MRRIYLCAVLFLCGQGLFAGVTPGFPASLSHNGDIFGTRVFVENRGQFNYKALPGEAIHFALDNGLEKIYFTSSGLVYEQVKMPAFTKREREKIEHDPHFRMPDPEVFYVNMTWQGRSSKVVIEKSEPQGHYLTYGEAAYNSRTFRRLTYRNVYDGIDFEFTIPADKSHGIKYNVIVHPGADLSQVKMLYSGDVRKMRIDAEGNVVIGTPTEDIVEHAPKTFYAGGNTPVASAFALDNGEISFVLPEGYDKKKELVIDPWVTTISSLTSNNYAYDVDYDFAGNTYIYGGYNPFKVARYSSTGVLQWTFAGTVPSQSWSTAPIVSQASNFAVNKYNSKTYIGQGYVGNGNRVIRLDATGNYDNFINTANANFQEVWDMGFHCTNDGEVFVLGGGVSSNISAVTINPTTAVISLSTFQPTNTGIAQDVASHAIDDAGKIFVLYAGSSGLNNEMCLVTSAFNNNVWTAPSTYQTFNEQGNKSSYVGAGGLSSNGFNALAVNANYLYYYDGSNLAAYNKATGAKVAFTTVPGLTIEEQGGIAVDDCDNLYLGGNNSILGYHFNGTAFSTITAISLNLTTQNKYVYDIKLDKGNKLLYVAGSGFVGTYSPVNSLACATASSICFNYQLLDHIICAGASVTLGAVSSSTLNNPSYTLQPLGLTTTTGSFVLTPTATAVYTIYVSGTNNSQGVVTYSAVSTVSVFPQPSVNPTVVQASCLTPTNSFNLNLTWNPPGSSAGYTIQWSQLPNGVSSPVQTSASGTIAQGLYTATVNTTWGCKAIGTFSINGPPAQSVFFRVPSAPYVLTCYNPVLNFSYTPATYNYTTTNGFLLAQNGPNPSITFTNAGGVYTVTGEHPDSKCISTQTFAVTMNTAAPVSAITPTFQNITCSMTAIQTITATANPTVNLRHEWISPQNTTLTALTPTANYVPGGPGPHIHCAVNTSNGCRTCKTFTIDSNDGFPSFTITSSPANYTLGCFSKSVTAISILSAQTTPSAGGAVSYTILPPGFNGSLQTPFLSTVQVYPITVPGSYTVITRDNSNFCDTKVYVSVLSNTLPPIIDTMLIPTTILTCDQPSVEIQALSGSPNVSGEWKLPGNAVLAGNVLGVYTNTTVNTNTIAGTYTFQLTDNNNLCLSTQSLTVYQTIIPPLAAIAGQNGISCKTETIVLSNISTSRVPPFFNPNKFVQAYKWMGPSPQEPLQASSSYVAYMPGTYTLIAKDLSNGCFAEATFTVADLRDFPLLLRTDPPIPDTLDCGNVSATISPVFADPNGNYTYTWTANSTTVQSFHNKTLEVRSPGQYQVDVLNPASGCLISAFFNVVTGTLTGNFEPDKVTGYASLPVKFKNLSTSSLDTSGIRSIWSFGNGTSVETAFAGESPNTVYTQPGTYTVTMYTFKGACRDTVVKLIEVDIPSDLEIPNVFTPNGDGANDLFFLNTSNITSIDMTIWDRWGNVVYLVNSTKGNVEWNGKNLKGKDVAEGVYVYTLKAKGRDGTDYDRKGNITLLR